MNFLRNNLYLLATVRLAARGLSTVTRTNPRVGCLIVKNQRVIGRGFHAKVGQNHAEIEAFKNSVESPKDAIVYCSLEPCSIHGRTPPCTQALIDAQVSRVVIGSIDSNPAVNGNGIATLREAGIVVDLVEIREARDVNCGYFKRMEVGLPYTRVKVATSLDGRIAMADGESRWITGPQARADAMHLRARSGAIVTGIGTVLNDDPKLNVRPPQKLNIQPLRVVLDTNGRLSPQAEILQQLGDVIVVCNSKANTTDKAYRWEHEHGTAQLDEVHQRLAEEGVNEVLVEAGSKLTGAYLETNLWDELVVYVAPKIMGSTARPLADMKIQKLCDSIGGKVQSVAQLGDDIKLVIVRVNQESD